TTSLTTASRLAASPGGSSPIETFLSSAIATAADGPSPGMPSRSHLTLPGESEQVPIRLEKDQHPLVCILDTHRKHTPGRPHRRSGLTSSSLPPPLFLIFASFLVYLLCWAVARPDASWHTKPLIQTVLAVAPDGKALPPEASRPAGGRTVPP